jgi:phosphoglycolate phosphatase
MTRLVCFDIDGTLLTSGGAGRRAFERCLRAVYGRVGRIDGYDFHGKTDPQIVYDLLGAEGVDPAQVEAGFAEFWPRYLSALAEELEVSKARGAVRAYPGVRELLGRLRERADVVLALLTGNVEGGAHLKLRAAGLDGVFRFGAYGSDSAVRTELPPIVLRRAAQETGVFFAGDRVVVVGDTPDDVACARCIGARGVAVATGRHAPAALRAAGADVVLESFEDVDRALAGLGLGGTLGRAG